jgi:hypothetical protein
VGGVGGVGCVDVGWGSGPGAVDEVAPGVAGTPGAQLVSKVNATTPADAPTCFKKARRL